MSCLFQWSEWPPRVTTQVDPHFQSSAFSAAQRGWFLLLHQMSMCHFDNAGCCRAPTWPGDLPPSVRVGGSWTGQREHKLQVTRGSLRTCQLQESKGFSDDQCHWSRRDETAHGITDPENNLPFFFFLAEEMERFSVFVKQKDGKAGHRVRNNREEKGKKASLIWAGMLEPCFLQGNRALCYAYHTVKPQDVGN